MKELINENDKLIKRLDELKVIIYGDILEESKHIITMNKDLNDLVALYESFISQRAA